MRLLATSGMRLAATTAILAALVVGGGCSGTEPSRGIEPDPGTVHVYVPEPPKVEHESVAIPANVDGIPTDVEEVGDIEPF